MKIINLILLLFVGFLCSCNQLPRKVLATTDPYIYVSPFNIYNGNYRNADFKAFSFLFPENVNVESKTFNGIIYQIEASGTNHYKIFVLPFENDVEKVGMLLANNSVFSYPYIKFKEGNIEGGYYNNYEESNPLKYEVFCYIKQGYTFCIFSYGTVEDYYSSFNIVKSTKIKASNTPIKERNKIATKLLQEFKKELLTVINTKFQEEGYNKVKILESFYCKDIETSIVNKNIKINCIIDGDYSQLYPGQRSMINNILINVDFSKSYDELLELLGYNISISYYKISGEKI